MLTKLLISKNDIKKNKLYVPVLHHGEPLFKKNLGSLPSGLLAS